MCKMPLALLLTGGLLRDLNFLQRKPALILQPIMSVPPPPKIRDYASSLRKQR